MGALAAALPQLYRFRVISTCGLLLLGGIWLTFGDSVPRRSEVEPGSHADLIVRVSETVGPAGALFAIGLASFLAGIPAVAAISIVMAGLDSARTSTLPRRRASLFNWSDTLLLESRTEWMGPRARLLLELHFYCASAIWMALELAGILGGMIISVVMVTATLLLTTDYKGPLYDEHRRKVAADEQALGLRLETRDRAFDSHRFP